MENIKDHFAGLAMQAIMQSEHHLEAADVLTKLLNKEDIEVQDAIAMLAYTQAEAMIKVRNKLNEEKSEEKTVPIIEGATLEGKSLTTLEGHNAVAWSTHNYLYSGEPRPNGIACPKCGEEMMDSNPMITLTSHPAQKNVHCPKCEYKGYRIA